MMVCNLVLRIVSGVSAISEMLSLCIIFLFHMNPGDIRSQSIDFRYLKLVDHWVCSNVTLLFISTF
jgi:hypothetical protein